MGRRKATLTIEDEQITVNVLPKLTYLSHGTNIMQKARVFSTMMSIKDKKNNIFNYIDKLLDDEKKGAVFEVLPPTGKYDAHQFTLFVSVKTSDVRLIQQRKFDHKKEHLKCEVVFVDNYTKVQFGDKTAVLCTDHDSVQKKYKIESIKFLRYFNDVSNSPNFLREFIYSDIRKKHVDIDFAANIDSTRPSTITTDLRERDALCKNQRVLLDTLNLLNMFSPSVVDSIADMLILSIDYNVWDKFLALSGNVTDLYISASDIRNIYPHQMEQCQLLKQITINDSTEQDAAEIKYLMFKNTDSLDFKNIFCTLKSLQYVAAGNNTYYVKKKDNGEYTELQNIVDTENLYFQDGFMNDLISQHEKLPQSTSTI